MRYLNNIIKYSMTTSSQIILFKLIFICLVKLHRRLCPIMLSLSLSEGCGLCIHFCKQCYLITIPLVWNPYLPVLKHPSSLVVLYTSIIQFVNIIFRSFLMCCKLVITFLLPSILLMDVVNNISSLFIYFNSSSVSP